MAELTEFEKVTDQLLSEKKWAEARELLSELPAPDIADSLPDLNKADRIVVFLKRIGTDMFDCLDHWRFLDGRSFSLFGMFMMEESAKLLSGLTFK